MPVFEKGYRRFDGELSRKNRILPMVLENVRTRVRWWIWILLLMAWAAPYAIYMIMTWVMTVGQSVVGTPFQGMALDPPTMVFERAVTNYRPELLVGMLTKSSPYLFWDAMQWSTTWALLLPAIACSGILASDRRTGALQIYFSRPVTRRDYLIAKAISTGAFTFAVTAVPTFFLWVECCLFSPDSMYFLKTWYVPFSIGIAGAIYSYWNAAIVMSLSSIVRRPVIVCVIALVIGLVLSATGPIVREASGNDAWLILVPQVTLGGITAPLFGLELPEWLRSPWLLLQGGVLPTALFGVVWMRLKAIEVHT